MLSKDYYIMKQNSRKGSLIPLYDISFPIFKTYIFLPFFIGRQTRPLGGVCVCACVCVCVYVGAGDYNSSLSAWQSFILGDR